MIERLCVNWKWFVNVYLVNEKVVRVEFADKPVKEIVKSNTAKMLKKDLERYFGSERVEFNYEVCLNFSDFVISVLEEVRKIPYGEVVTYGEIAKKLKTSPRAVGRALKLNPTPIIIPCHRVIAKNGLGGFSSGLDVKRELLKLEGVKFDV
jgi:methylated-DNA-[protein]-cysteine S-methyltransferase